MEKEISIVGPIELIDGHLTLRIPLRMGGQELAPIAPPTSSVKGDFLYVVIPEWLAEKISVKEGSLVDVTNQDGKFNIIRNEKNGPILSRVESYQCTVCGRISEMKEVFKPLSGSRYICFECSNKTAFKQMYIYLSVYLFFGAVGLYNILAHPQDSVGWPMFLMFSLILARIISVIPHELGHAWMAQLLGWEVYWIQCGFGTPLFKFKIFGISVQVHQYPFGGAAFIGSTSSNQYRAKQFLVSLAGPLMNLILCLTSWWALMVFGRYTTLSFGSIGQESIPLDLAVVFLGSIAIMNGVAFIYNIIPLRLDYITQKNANDGMTILTTFFRSQSVVDQNLASSYSMSAAFSGLTRKKYATVAKAFFEEKLPQYRNVGKFMMSYAYWLLKSAQFAEARRLYTELIESGDMTPVAQYQAMADLSEAYLGMKDQDLLKTADEGSEKAFRNGFWIPHYKGTRGKVLVAMGQCDIAMPLLKDAMKNVFYPAYQADYACYLALAEMKLGYPDKAKNYIDLAQKIDPYCPNLEILGTIAQSN